MILVPEFYIFVNQSARVHSAFQSGRLMDRLPAPAGQEVSLNVAAYPQGIYFISVEAAGTKYYTRIVKN